MNIFENTLLAFGLTTTLLAAGLATAPRSVTPETPLGEHMEGLKTHLKGTATALQGADRAKALEHIAELQRLVLLAKLEEPSNLAEVPEADQAAHRTAFRADLARVLGVLVEMELDVLDGQLEQAFQHVVDPLFPMREAAHEKYQLKSD